jgi:hypothetical protein
MMEAGYMNDNANAQMEMPKYKCHKEVHALKIKHVDHMEHGAMITPEEAGFAKIEVSEAYVKAHHPKEGGYYVVYKGGYESFSPADAFEGGYDRIGRDLEPGEFKGRPEPKGETCGRRENGIEGEDGYGLDDNSCSYCGSLNPDEFMRRVEAGDVTLSPTDKNYKVYICNDGGEPFKQTYRPDGTGGANRDEWIWTTREMSLAKFYFQHLSKAQQHRFIELMNEKKAKLNTPGHFYSMPFFMVEDKKVPD